MRARVDDETERAVDRKVREITELVKPGNLSFDHKVRILLQRLEKTDSGENSSSSTLDYEPDGSAILGSNDRRGKGRGPR